MFFVVCLVESKIIYEFLDMGLGASHGDFEPKIEYEDMLLEVDEEKSMAENVVDIL